MTIIDVLRQSNTSNWLEGLKWLILNLFAGFMFYWASYIILIDNAPSFRDLARHGELALYSVSLVTEGIYVISKGIQIKPKFEKESKGDDEEQDIRSRISLNFPGLGWFLILILILALSSTTLFAGSIAADILGISNTHTIDLRINYTIAVVVVSLLTTFAITVISNATEDLKHDPYQLMQTRYEKFEKRYQRNSRRGD